MAFCFEKITAHKLYRQSVQLTQKIFYQSKSVFIIDYLIIQTNYVVILIANESAS